MKNRYRATLPNPPDEKQLRVAIQKKDGRLFPASSAYMRKMGFDIAPIMRPSQRRRIWDVSSQWGHACLLVCSIQDILTNVSKGHIDIGIVSSDALGKWKNANKEAFETITHVHDLGPAGSSLMFGIRPDLMGRENATWKQALQHCDKSGIPVVTCDEHRLRNFLKRQRIITDHLKVSQPEGSVEAHGVLLRTPLICDQVETGGTMQEHGYRPVPGVDIAESRVLLIGALPRQPNRRKIFGEVWKLATAEA